MILRNFNKISLLNLITQHFSYKIISCIHNCRLANLDILDLSSTLHHTLMPQAFFPKFKKCLTPLALFVWHVLTFGNSWSYIKLTLSIRCQYFFSKSNSHDYLFSKLYRIESTTDEIIATLNHFNNFLIIYRFSTINPPKTIINWFQRIKQNGFFHRFNGPIIFKIFEGNN